MNQNFNEIYIVNINNQKTSLNDWFVRIYWTINLIILVVAMCFCNDMIDAKWIDRIKKSKDTHNSIDRWTIDEIEWEQQIDESNKSSMNDVKYQYKIFEIPI